MASSTSPVSFLGRFLVAWGVGFRVLFDGQFAARVRALAAGAPDAASLPAAAEEPALADAPRAAPTPGLPPSPPTDDVRRGAALQLLGLLQREGRFVDFLEEDIASFSDADIGAAARVVHAGCRKALREHCPFEPIRQEQEGASIVLSAGFAAQEVKLVGNVTGSPPYRGVLRHRGWRAKHIELPFAVDGHDPHVVAQAELEL